MELPGKYIVSLKVDKIANKFTIYIYCSGKSF